MTLEEFRKKYSGGPYTLDQFALDIIKHLDEENDEDLALVRAADRYLKYKRKFQDKLREHDIERG